MYMYFFERFVSFFFYVDECLPACMCECHMHTWYQWRLENSIKYPGAGVTGIVSCLIWVLKIRPWSSARTVTNLYRPYLFLVCVYWCAMAHVQRSKDTFAEASSPFRLFGFWGPNLRLKLGRQILYPLSHLTGPKFTFVVTESFSILINLSIVLLAMSLSFKNLHSCPSRHDCIAEILIWISPMTGDIEYSFM